MNYCCGCCWFTKRMRRRAIREEWRMVQVGRGWWWVSRKYHSNGWNLPLCRQRDLQARTNQNRLLFVTPILFTSSFFFFLSFFLFCLCFIWNYFLSSFPPLPLLAVALVLPGGPCAGLLALRMRGWSPAPGSWLRTWAGGAPVPGSWLRAGANGAPEPGSWLRACTGRGPCAGLLAPRKRGWGPYGGPPTQAPLISSGHGRCNRQRFISIESFDVSTLPTTTTRRTLRRHNNNYFFGNDAQYWKQNGGVVCTQFSKHQNTAILKCLVLFCLFCYWNTKMCR